MESMIHGEPRAAEPAVQRAVRILVGALLLVEALGLLLLGGLVAIFAPLMAALAFLWGGGGATPAQMKQVVASVLFMMVAPFAVTASLALASVFLLLRRRPALVASLCTVAIVTQLMAQAWVREPVSIASMQSSTSLVGMPAARTADRPARRRRANRR